MKKLFNKINELWLNFKKWSDTNILGYLIGSTVKIILIIIVFVSIYYAVFTTGAFKDDSSSNSTISDSSDTSNDNCTVRGIELHGMIATYLPLHADNDTNFNYDSVSSENVAYAIKQANDDERINAILIDTDSSGGYPVAGEEISIAIKNSKKPIIALIREQGDSAAYWAISSASKIFASRNSEVGSIGVTQSYLSNVKKNAKDGLTYESLSTGKFKDAGNADKPLTAEEKALFMRDLNIIYNNFIADVAQNRKIPIDKVRSFSDGSTVLGTKALELGLIDQIGGLPEVEQYLEKTTGETSTICW
ncbi:MAG: S49 family peptidase [Candidatus Paceibacterota bacterium]